MIRTPPVGPAGAAGNIVDRDGAILAGSAEARYVFADPELVKDPAGVADALSSVLGVPRSELLPKLRVTAATTAPSPGSSTARLVFLADTGARVSDLDLAGIGAYVGMRAWSYFNHDLAANLIGFTGEEMNGLEGPSRPATTRCCAGSTVSGASRSGSADGPVDLDQEIPGGFHEETPARPGSSLQLTIDRDLQYEVRKRILGTGEDDGGQGECRGGQAAVLDVRTGEVLSPGQLSVLQRGRPVFVA